MTIGLFVLGIYVVSVMNMHYRGAVRFPWMRQMLTHTNYLAPYNLLMNLCSKLPNKPLLTVDDIADLKLIRDNWEVIRDEAVQLANDGQVKVADSLNDMGFNSFFRVGWARFYLKWYDDPLPSAIEKCPKTLEILGQTKSINAAMFASLPPGATLKPHRDPYAGSLRYHLGLVTPNDDDCYIDVDGQNHSWRDGKDVLFDETFIHEAHNKTDKPRIIFFADVHRPMRYKIIDRINHWISDHIIKASSSRNDETDKVGVLNRMFEKVYGIRTVSRRIKKWNRKFYYGLKYSLFFGLIYLIFF